SATATPANANTGQNITFAASAYDPDGDSLTYAWSFGDSNYMYGTTVVHAYSAVGIYTATITVFDDKGGMASKDVVVTVVNQPPKITDASATPNPGTVGQFIAFSASAADPDIYDTLTYTWTFADTSSPVIAASVTHTYTATRTY